MSLKFLVGVGFKKRINRKIVISDDDICDPITVLLPFEKKVTVDPIFLDRILATKTAAFDDSILTAEIFRVIQDSRKSWLRRLLSSAKRYFYNWRIMDISRGKLKNRINA